jgi:hypothetical protein
MRPIFVVSRKKWMRRRYCLRKMRAWKLWNKATLCACSKNRSAPCNRGAPCNRSAPWAGYRKIEVHALLLQVLRYFA